MRQVVIRRHGGPEVLEIQEAADPEPGEGDIRIRVRAAGINFADILARIGLYPDAPKPPVVVGYEVAGVVDAVGRGVTTVHRWRSRHGADALRRIRRTRGRAGGAGLPIPRSPERRRGGGCPGHLPHADDRAVPDGRAHLRRDGADSQRRAADVGIAATQLARLRRAIVIGTASAVKHDALRRFGVEHAIDYRHANVEAEVKRITNGRGVDVILDPIGGTASARATGCSRRSGGW